MSVKDQEQILARHGESHILTPSKIDLRDAHAIRRELASVYRDMRSGAIESQDGTRLAYVLDMIRKAYETSEIQDRLESLEIVLNERKKHHETNINK